MRKPEIVAHLEAIGWEADSYGHFHKEVTCKSKSQTGPAWVVRDCRVRVSDLSCRIELASRDSEGKKTWIRIGGGYYKDFVKLPDGRLRIGSYFFPARTDVRTGMDDGGGDPVSNLQGSDRSSEPPVRDV